MNNPKILCIGREGFQEKVRHEFLGKNAERNGLNEGGFSLNFTGKITKTTKRKPDYVFLEGLIINEAEDIHAVRKLFKQAEIVVLSPHLNPRLSGRIMRREFNYLLLYHRIEKFARYISGVIFR